jgi:hypothetical protein
MNTKYKDPTRKRKKRGGETASRRAAPETELHFSSRNYVILGSAAAVILVGFFSLSRGSITLAPILLVLGYCILIPYGLAAGGRRPAADRTPGE